MTQYTVKSGDSLSKIALQFYGTYSAIGNWNPVTALAQANNITNVDVIYPGMVITIPDKPVSTASASTPSTQATTQASAPTGDSSKTVKYFLYSLLIGGLAFVGYREYKKRKKKKTSA